MSDRLTSAQLRYWRKTMHGLKQGEAAGLLGLSLEAYRKQEQGVYPVTRQTTLLAMLPIADLQRLAEDRAAIQQLAETE